MKKTINLLFVCVLFTIFSTIALADIRLPDTANPKPSKGFDTTLMIKLDKNAKEAKLIIPKDQLKQLRAELEQLDNGTDTTASANTGFTRIQTIISGSFMSLALLFGGVWFTRSRKVSTKAGKAMIAGVVLFLAASVTTATFANMGPPFETRSITGKIFTPAVHQWKQAYGKIRVETAGSGNVTLIVPDVPDDKPNKEE